MYKNKYYDIVKYMDKEADILYGRFEWSLEKARLNKERHRLDFYDAILAFCDPHRVIAEDEKHSDKEERFFCLGKVGSRIATVRFAYRKDRIRIIGAGFWRKGKKFYEEENQIKK